MSTSLRCHGLDHHVALQPFLELLDRQDFPLRLFFSRRLSKYLLYATCSWGSSNDPAFLPESCYKKFHACAPGQPYLTELAALQSQEVSLRKQTTSPGRFELGHYLAASSALKVTQWFSRLFFNWSPLFVSSTPAHAKCGTF